MTGLRRVFISNRGESAIRITKAAAALGMESVGVYPRVDALSLHRGSRPKHASWAAVTADRQTP